MAFGRPGTFSEQTAQEYNDRFGDARGDDYREVYDMMIDHYLDKGLTYGSETFEIFNYTGKDKERIDTIRDEFLIGKVSNILGGKS